MSTTTPTKDISIEERQKYRQGVIEAGKAQAIYRCLAPSREELIWRDLAPEDLGLTAWATPAIPSGGSYTAWISHTVATRCCICIYKVLQLSNNPTVTSIRLKLAAHTIWGIHELETCYSGLPIIKNLAKALMSPEAKEVMDRLAGRSDIGVSPDFGAPMEAYFGEPYVYNSLDQCVIEVKSRAASPGDYLVLGGYVIEPGATIS